MDKSILFISNALLRPDLSQGDRKIIIQKQLERLDLKDDVTESIEIPDGLEWFNSSGPLSFKSNLKGKIVVLDFFTYCCINCMHILPDLEALEEKYSTEDGVVVIGVHSAKFENEKVSSNIKNAILRYNIHHPVVNDPDALMWDNLEITCWPTLLIVGPSGEPILTIIGEGHRDILFETVQLCLEHFRSKDLLSSHSLPRVRLSDSLEDSTLLYPGKVAPNPSGTLLAISDTGHNRVVITTVEGDVQQCIGGTEIGFKDGLYQEARFHAPQGLCWSGDVIYVADTENHAIRKIDLKEQRVVTVTGTGVQGIDKYGGGEGVDQVVSSPWDLALGAPNEDILFIAMAGTHQLWGLYLNDGQWLKAVPHSAGTCMNYAGSGKEENRNNSYPRKAGFAQPSGITLAPGEPYDCMFVADSESSTIRRIAFKDGAVKNVVGGALDPMDLFAYGDSDGKGLDARLQHPLGVAWDNSKLLFVADSYNHKIKMVDPAKRYCATYAGSGSQGKRDSDDLLTAEFNEPGGLAMSPCGCKIFVADTNNHAIRCLDIRKSSVTEIKITMPPVTAVDSGPAAPAKVKSMLSKSVLPSTVDAAVVSGDGRLSVTLNVTLPPGSYLTEGAPSAWQIFVPGSEPLQVLAKTRLGSLLDPSPLHHSWTVPTETSLSGNLSLQVEAAIYYCLPSGVCRMHCGGYTIPIHRQEGAGSATQVTLSMAAPDEAT